MNEHLISGLQNIEHDLPWSRDTRFPEYKETGAVVGSLRCERSLGPPMTSDPV